MRHCPELLRPQNLPWDTLNLVGDNNSVPSTGANHIIWGDITHWTNDQHIIWGDTAGVED